jgi:hypothetical protein
MKAELDEMLQAGRFQPFVITTHDGFAIAIEAPHRTLTGKRMIIISDAEGNFYHIPYSGISHISEPRANGEGGSVTP